jgi:hypothetical protein
MFSILSIVLEFLMLLFFVNYYDMMSIPKKVIHLSLKEIQTSYIEVS